ncbi:MAG TPA: AMP-binding protein, partial [Burkholderiaceae bacterium]|nr:AMP-binding protein [Burkholderiaceae bacterium]
VAAQAEGIPRGASVANLCVDRYRFTVMFAAAAVRGATSLFPPNALPGTLAALESAHPGLLVTTGAAAAAGSEADLAVLSWIGSRESRQALPDASQIPLVDADLPAACLLTSGSTGVPQPHFKRWSQLVRNVAAASARLAEVTGDRGFEGMNIVATVPPQHSYGFESSVLAALLGGAAFDAGRPFYPADIAAALQRLPRPRALVTTPFHLRALMAADVQLPPTDAVLCATAPLSPQLAQACERRVGGPLFEIYGCTEAGQVASRRTSTTDVWETFGSLTIRAEVSSDGERYTVSGGHVDEPTPLADLLQLEDGGRHFRLLGRTHDVIHVAGKRASLAHLDWHINSLEGVRDAAFWLPGDVEDGVVRLVAFVVAPGRSSADILAGLRPRIEPAFLPRRVVLLDALPREATGKLTHQALQALALRHAGAAAP